MYITFLDDSKQNNPTRVGMKKLLAIGGIIVPCEHTKKAESELEQLCIDTGFPKHEEFKWSPGREKWMPNNLIEKERQSFFLEVVKIITRYKSKVLVVIVDRDCQCATDTTDHEIDAINLILERIEKKLKQDNAYGIVVVDRPSGNRSQEDSFLYDTLETLQNGSGYGVPEHICFNILSSPSKYIRLLQVADLVTACTLAYVSGEENFSPPIFKKIKKLFCDFEGRIGGIGLKIHPDFKYANLYHWLVEDTLIWRHGVGYPLPKEGFQYYTGPDKS